MAVGFGIFQEAPDNLKQRTCAKLGSITLNEREARFSQPKRELYGLMRALQANKYWLVGCRKLVVETDAKYLKGMLSNPGVGPNATVTTRSLDPNTAPSPPNAPPNSPTLAHPLCPLWATPTLPQQTLTAP
ncbi:hypothetical protein J132_07173 [Termitomyces sp. J132]|nr:hypothetical protein J132_07173 [Termitomyces sp. J132]